MRLDSLHLLALSAAAFGRSGPAMVTSILITTRLTKSYGHLMKNGSHLVQMTRLYVSGRPKQANVYVRLLVMTTLLWDVRFLRMASVLFLLVWITSSYCGTL